MKFRVAAIQMTSTAERDANLRDAAERLADAAAGGAELAALPENFSFLRAEGERVPDPEPPCSTGSAIEGSPEAGGRVTGWLRERAREHRIWILGGTVAERQRAGVDDARVYNTSMLLNPEGTIVACYRKLHLFDVSIRGGPDFRESQTVAAGVGPVLADTPFGPAGLSVCYDLRFPELYRTLTLRGARMLFVPSAFTAHTGKDHWEPLLRARAIENQCYVVAPAQIGRHSPRRTSHGHAMIIDPWGTILARAPDRPGVVFADLDSEHLEEIRRALPALDHVRKDLLRS